MSAEPAAAEVETLLDVVRHYEERTGRRPRHVHVNHDTWARLEQLNRQCGIFRTFNAKGLTLHKFKGQPTETSERDPISELREESTEAELLLQRALNRALATSPRWQTRHPEGRSLWAQG